MKRFLLGFLCVLTLFVSACDDAPQGRTAEVGGNQDIFGLEGTFPSETSQSSSIPIPVDPPVGRIAMAEGDGGEDPLQRWRRLQSERLQRELEKSDVIASDRVIDRSKFKGRRIAETHRMQFELEAKVMKQRYDRDFQACLEFGCEIQNTNLTPNRNAHINAKIPPEFLGAYLDFLAEGDGKLKQHTVSTDDKTSAFIDTEAKLKNLEALKERLLKMLDSDKVENVSQLLEVEKELSRVETQLDSTKGRLRHLLSITGMATVQVNYNVYSYEQQFEAQSLKYSMRKSWQSFQNSISKVIIFTGAIVPWIPVFLIGLWLTFFAIRLGIGKARLLPRMFARKSKDAVKEEPKPKAKTKAKTKT